MPRATRPFPLGGRWATEKADLCREMGDEVEYLRTQAEIGAAMAALGQWAEAHRKLDDAIRQLDVPGRSVFRLFSVEMC